MKIKKVSQSAGIIAEIEQNLDSNSAVNAPSVKAVKNAIEKVDAKNNYSTEEQVIGTWMGKPLYRKVVTINEIVNITANTWTDTGITIPNKELLIKCYEITYNNLLSFRYSNDNVQAICFTGLNLLKGDVLVIEYTKTTD